MERALIAAAFYFQIAFAVGFALGTLRALLIAPRIGELAAVIIELPIILAASWGVAGRLIARYNVLPAQRPAMGAFAFLLLIVTEAALAVLLFGRTIDEHLAHLRTTAGATGLAGQIVFAAIPTLRYRA